MQTPKEIQDQASAFSNQFPESTYLPNKILQDQGVICLWIGAPPQPSLHLVLLHSTSRAKTSIMKKKIAS